MPTRISPTIRTKKLLLRHFTEGDLENVYKGLSHPEVIKYYGISYQSLEETKEQMEWFAKPEQNWWAICSADAKNFYGAGGLNDISLEHKKAEIGLWLLPEFWGMGIMTEALPIICKFGFENLGLHRIEGIVETENINCKRAMEKLHFRLEGTMRECEIKNGQFISLDIYAQLKNEQ